MSMTPHSHHVCFNAHATVVSPKNCRHVKIAVINLIRGLQLGQIHEKVLSYNKTFPVKSAKFEYILCLSFQSIRQRYVLHPASPYNCVHLFSILLLYFIRFLPQSSTSTIRVVFLWSVLPLSPVFLSLSFYNLIPVLTSLLYNFFPFPYSS